MIAIFDLFYICREQELSNLLQANQFDAAVRLAISLDQPYRVLKIFKGQWFLFMHHKKMCIGFHQLFHLFVILLYRYAATTRWSTAVAEYS